MSKRKRRRGKKVFPTRYASDFINVTQRPRQLVLDRRESEGDHWLNRHGRVQSTVGPSNNKEPKFNNTFMQQVPETKGHIRKSWVDDAGVIHYAEKTPKMEIRAIHKEWASTITKWGVDTYHFIVVAGLPNRVMKLFFCGNSYFWVEEFKDQGFARRSKEYIGREQAERVYKFSRITWLYEEPLEIPQA